MPDEKLRVWKVVHREPDDRLVSAVIRQSDRGAMMAGLATRFQRVYRRKDGGLLKVRRCLAFDSFDHAEFFRMCEDDGLHEIWEAECLRAKPIKLVCDPGYAPPSAFAAFARCNGKRDGWDGHGMSAPSGTLYCRNLRLVRRVDD